MLGTFHSHSIFSDGSHSPEVLVMLAKEKNFDFFSLTDHDTTLGISEARKTAQKLNIAFIDGVEIQADINPQHYEHILSYGIHDYSKMDSFLDTVRAERMQLISSHIAKLRNLGYSIDLESIDNLTPGRHLTVGHIANWLKHNAPSFFSGEMYSINTSIPPSYHYSDEVIKLITECGGISVLAHPFRYNDEFNYNPDKFDSFIRKLTDFGLGGIETFYGTHTPKQIHLCQMMSQKYGLIQTGGSDWHGWSDPTPFGIEVPAKDVEILLELSAR